MSETPPRSEMRPPRRPAASGTARRTSTAARLAPDDALFRQIVRSMRNGVIAFRRDGTLALMNDEAYRIFGLTRSADDCGRPFADVLRSRPPVRLQVEQTEIAEILQQSVTMAESKTPRGDVRVDIHLEPSLPQIHADQHQLAQVFTNLIANAFEALEAKGRITISAVTSTIDPDPALAGPSAPTPSVVIDVIDDGPGLKADVI